MNRLWIGVGLLLVILAVGFGFLWGSQRFYGELGDNLEQAGQLALEGNWTAATEKTRQSRQAWSRHHHFWSAFTDHEPIEDVQNLLSQLELYAQQRLSVDFAGVCFRLSHLAEAINESHHLKWWSIL